MQLYPSGKNYWYERKRMGEVMGVYARIILAGCAAAFITSAAVAQTDECWTIGSFEGQNALAPEYEHFPDSLASGQMICLSGDTGFVSGNDIPLVRLGPNTLVGYSSNTSGLESLTTYQIDRVNRRVLFSPAAPSNLL
jgi:hypothetical protein